jgi:prophage antirepressor-like protein
MSNVIQFPTFNGQQIRHAMIAGEPWFVAIDACRSIALEVGAGGVARFVKALDPDEKRVIRKVPAWKRVIEKADDPYAALFGEFDSILTLISEPGLYKLIQRSNKPEAKLFDRWVRHDVLPSIRKTGGSGAWSRGLGYQLSRFMRL